MTRMARAGTVFSVSIVFLLCMSAVAFAETETQSVSSTTTQPGDSQQTLQFSLVPSPIPNLTGYRQGSGSGSVQVQGTLLAVHMQAEGMAPGTHFMLVLLANGTAQSVANMTTDSEGEVESEASAILAPGHYEVGLRVFDTSSFASPESVLVSSPGSLPAVVGQSGGSTSTQTEQETQSVSTFQGGQSEDDGIRTAIQTKVIPAVVDVGESGSYAYVTDSSFSVSVGRFDQSGYQISISAANVTGPRVLLVNLTSSLARGLFSNPMVIALDGAKVQQASSFSQVIGAKAGDPARFIVVEGSAGFALLVSIPHFSYHTIAIFPVLAQAAAALLVDLPTLIISVLVVSAVFAVAYSRRVRAEI